MQGVPELGSWLCQSGPTRWTVQTMPVAVSLGGHHITCVHESQQDVVDDLNRAALFEQS